MKISKFDNALMFSNKNVEKAMRKVVNESCNAVLMEVFEDKCILADHTTGQIFEADFSFDGKTFVFENFNEVQLEKDDDSLKESIGSFFDDEIVNLSEAYEKFASKTADNFENSLTEALSSKNMEEVINYDQLSEADFSEIKETKLFEDFSARINSHPLNNVKKFNWSDPVKVSLIDEDLDKVVNKSLKTKAKKLKSNVEFKKALKESAEELMNGNSYAIEELVNENVEIVGLDKAELKELVGFSVIGDKDLMESRNKIVKAIENIISESDELSNKKAVIFEEANETEDSDAPEANEADVEKAIDALEKAKENISDDKLAEKIDSIIDALNNAKDAGETDVAAVKECVSLFNL